MAKKTFSDITLRGVSAFSLAITSPIPTQSGMRAGLLYFDVENHSFGYLDDEGVKQIAPLTPVQVLASEDGSSVFVTEDGSEVLRA